MNVNLFFDFDMTLGYRIMMWRDTVRELLLEEGVVVSVDDIRSFSDGRGYPWSLPHLTHEEFLQGKSWWANTEEFLLESLLMITDSKRAERAAARFRAKYIDMKYWGIFPDTIPTLAQLKSKGYKLYILSNHVPEATNIIKNLGISDYMEHIFISADIGAEKPNPLIYHKALSITDEGDYNIMIGDNYEADIEGALNGGFHNAILVRKKNEYNYPLYCRYLEDIDPIIEGVKNENR